MPIVFVSKLSIVIVTACVSKFVLLASIWILLDQCVSVNKSLANVCAFIVNIKQVIEIWVFTEFVIIVLRANLHRATFALFKHGHLLTKFVIRIRSDLLALFSKLAFCIKAFFFALSFLHLRINYIFHFVQLSKR